MSADHAFIPDPVPPLCTLCDEPRERHPSACQDCGMAHGLDEPERCIEGHGDDPIQVTIHGKYGKGPMPVEFRDAMVEMVRLVKQGIDDGTLPVKRRQPTASSSSGATE